MKSCKDTRAKISLVIMRVPSSSFLLSFVAVALLAGPSIIIAESPGEAEKAGALLYREKGCEFCHGVGGVGGKKGPRAYRTAHRQGLDS